MSASIRTYQQYNEAAFEYLGQNKITEAITAFVLSIELEENLEAYTYLATIYNDIGEVQLAFNAASASLKFNDKIPIIYKIMGISTFKYRDLPQAFIYFQTALELDPKIELCNFYLGQILYSQQKIFKAIEYYRNEIDINPNFYGAYIALGDTLSQLGFSTEGAKFYKHGTRANPCLKFYHHLLYIMFHDPQSTEEDIYNLTVEAYNKVLKPIKDSIPNDIYDKPLPVLDPNKKLRIGLVSPNFKLRSAEMWMRNVFPELAKEFDLYFYHCEKFEDAETNKYFKPIATKWLNITDMSDAQAAKAIRDDQIDILVDLLGHVPMAGNRISLFIYEAAPVQISWLHYFATTALPEMDYVIADHYSVPSTSERFYTEKVYKLPNFSQVFTQKPYVLNIDHRVELPVKKNNYITFGNLSRFQKVHTEVLETWSKVLNQVDNSRLILGSGVFADEQMREYILHFFESRGVARYRIILDAYPPTVEEFLIKHNEIDIILDSFPFSGATSMFDACWMGVPSIMLYSPDRWPGRGPAACLDAIVQNSPAPNLTARNIEEYVSNAVKLANDIDKLQYYKNSLRDDFLNSVLYNSPVFSKDLSDAFNYIWRDCCKIKNNTDNITTTSSA